MGGCWILSEDGGAPLNSSTLGAFQPVSQKDQHLKLYFTLKSNFLRFSLKLKGCEIQQ